MNKRIDPRIFHKNTAEDYLRAAIETANWIDTLAVKTEYGRIWKALPEGQEGYREDVPMFTSKSMYDGSAGIGIFMIRLYEATSDARWLKEAEEAAALQHLYPRSPHAAQDRILLRSRVGPHPQDSPAP